MKEQAMHELLVYRNKEKEMSGQVEQTAGNYPESRFSIDRFKCFCRDPFEEKQHDITDEQQYFHAPDAAEVRNAEFE